MSHCLACFLNCSTSSVLSFLQVPLASVLSARLAIFVLTSLFTWYPSDRNSSLTMCFLPSCIVIVALFPLVVMLCIVTALPSIGTPSVIFSMSFIVSGLSSVALYSLCMLYLGCVSWFAKFPSFVNSNSPSVFLSSLPIG